MPRCRPILVDTNKDWCILKTDGDLKLQKLDDRNYRLVYNDHVLALADTEDLIKDDMETLGQYIKKVEAKLSKNLEGGSIKFTVAGNVLRMIDKEWVKFWLWDPIVKGDTEKLKKFFVLEPSCTRYTDENGRTPLHIAAESGTTEVLQCLIEYSKQRTKALMKDNRYKLDPLVIDLNAKDQFGWTPLHCAAKSFAFSAVEILVNYGCNVNALTSTDVTPLAYISTYSGSDWNQLKKAVETLVDNGADINCCNNFLETPLHLASFKGNVNLIEYLLDNGANVHLTNSSGETALHYASQGGHIGVIEILLAHNVDETVKSVNGTCLDTASDPKVQEYLESIGVQRAKDPNGTNRPRMLTAAASGTPKRPRNTTMAQKQYQLHRACKQGDDKLVSSLLRDPSMLEHINLPDDQKMTPVQYASTSGNLRVVFQLLSMKNIVLEQLTPTDGSGILHGMVRNKANQDPYLWERILKVMKSKGYNIGLQNVHGATALHEAAVRGHENAVEALVKYPELLNITTKNGETALHYAARGGYMKIVKMLLYSGCDKSIKGKDGTALDLALGSGRSDIITLLKMFRDIDLKTSEKKERLSDDSPMKTISQGILASKKSDVVNDNERKLTFAEIGKEIINDFELPTDSQFVFATTASYQKSGSSNTVDGVLSLWQRWICWKGSNDQKVRIMISNVTPIGSPNSKKKETASNMVPVSYFEPSDKSMWTCKPEKMGQTFGGQTHFYFRSDRKEEIIKCINFLIEFRNHKGKLLIDQQPLEKMFGVIKFPTQNTTMHKLFQCIPKNEIIEEAFSCSSRSSALPVPGDLYVTPSQLCFGNSALLHGRKQIPFSDVKSICLSNGGTKQLSLLVTTKLETLRFTSFDVDINLAYNKIEKIWYNSIAKPRVAIVAGHGWINRMLCWYTLERIVKTCSYIRWIILPGQPVPEADELAALNPPTGVEVDVIDLSNSKLDELVTNNLANSLVQIHKLVVLMPILNPSSHDEINAVLMSKGHWMKQIILVCSSARSDDHPLGGSCKLLERTVKNFCKTQGIAYTLLRSSAALMQLFFEPYIDIKQENVFRLPLEQKAISWLDLEDVAPVVSAIVGSTKTVTLPNTLFYITGPEALTCQQLANIFSQETYAEIQYIDCPFSVLRDLMENTKAEIEKMKSDNSLPSSGSEKKYISVENEEDRLKIRKKEFDDSAFSWQLFICEIFKSDPRYSETTKSIQSVTGYPGKTFKQFILKHIKMFKDSHFAYFSASQHSQIVSQFMILSQNGTAINVDNFAKSVGFILSDQTPDHSIVKALFRKFKMNREEDIGQNEFITNLSVMTKGSLREQYRYVFDLLDADSDGFITKVDWQRFLSSVVNSLVNLNIPHEHVQTLIDVPFEEFDLFEEDEEKREEDEVETKVETNNGTTSNTQTNNQSNDVVQKGCSDSSISTSNSIINTSNDSRDETTTKLNDVDVAKSSEDLYTQAFENTESISSTELAQYASKMELENISCSPSSPSNSHSLSSSPSTPLSSSVPYNVSSTSITPSSTPPSGSITPVMYKIDENSSCSPESFMFAPVIVTSEGSISVLSSDLVGSSTSTPTLPTISDVTDDSSGINTTNTEDSSVMNDDKINEVSIKPDNDPKSDTNDNTNNPDTSNNLDTSSTSDTSNTLDTSNTSNTCTSSIEILPNLVNNGKPDEGVDKELQRDINNDDDDNVNLQDNVDDNNQVKEINQNNNCLNATEETKDNDSNNNNSVHDNGQEPNQDNNVAGAPDEHSNNQDKDKTTDLTDDGGHHKNEDDTTTTCNDNNKDNNSIPDLPGGDLHSNPEHKNGDDTTTTTNNDSSSDNNVIDENRSNVKPLAIDHDTTTKTTTTTYQETTHEENGIKDSVHEHNNNTNDNTTKPNNTIENNSTNSVILNQETNNNNNNKHDVVHVNDYVTDSDTNNNDKITHPLQVNEDTRKQIRSTTMAQSTKRPFQPITRHMSLSVSHENYTAKGRTLLVSSSIDIKRFQLSSSLPTVPTIPLRRKMTNLLEMVSYEVFEKRMKKRDHLIRTLGVVRKNETVMNYDEIKKKGFLVAFGHKSWELVQYIMWGIHATVQSVIDKMEDNKSFVGMNEWTESFFSEKITENLSLPGSKDEWEFVASAPLVFWKIRDHFGVDHQKFVHSLGPSTMLGNILLGRLSTYEEVVSTGRSGSFFFKSTDGKYFIKSLPPEEHMFLERNLSSYYRHIKQHPNSLLARFYGLFRITQKQGNNSLRFVVMENILSTPLEIHETYDLKGSTVGRSVAEKLELFNPNIALKDMDLHRHLSLGPHMKAKVLEQIESDVKFLTSLNICDYSLLVGIHFATDPVPKDRPTSTSLFREYLGGIVSRNSLGYERKFVLFIGIIDFLTMYDFKKKGEHVLKSIIHDSNEISAIAPEPYKRRFLRYLTKIME
eukprot:TRINITY_DN4150_c1_g1_i1.p1 TRINITY_DN4150_c1_g1~~TRINITY_DN4150_c1_g1_i1.p1  ORF type:complete len:2406 (+),score=580.76 TRINITY_DN4150_c1_g1_i1:18-7235(+)